MFKSSAIFCALSLLATAALAQTTSPPQPPMGPTQAQCDQGWKEGSQWTKDEFTTACQKLKSRN
jgi:Spy/CpxP family protein refolding chaperone